MSAADRLYLLRSPLPGGVWSWERNFVSKDERRDSWTLYVDRGEPMDPDRPRGMGNEQHGYNILGGADFDVNGENLRALILGAANLSSEMLTEREVERKAWARLVRAAENVAVTRTGFFADTRFKYLSELAEAKRALRDLGVDVDMLMEEA